MNSDWSTAVQAPPHAGQSPLKPRGDWFQEPRPH